jgi:hypothetical protein
MVLLPICSMLPGTLGHRGCWHGARQRDPSAGPFVDVFRKKQFKRNAAVRRGPNYTGI